MKELVRQLLATRESVATGEIVAVTGLSRQAVQYHLRSMVGTGELRRAGQGRGVRYSADPDLFRTYPVEHLEEHRVWEDVRRETPGFGALRPNVLSICRYALTEIVNNAIDHSGTAEVRVSVWSGSSSLAFRVVDEGIGVFRHVRDRLGLKDDLDALQQISKGKTTTDPERHSGEGIFFVSKAVDVFVIEANGIRWTVDNLRADQAAGQAASNEGTGVWWRISRGAQRELTDVFGEFTDEDLRFARSRTVMRLFAQGPSFVSRSEAKRLVAGLDRFAEVSVDFAGVTEVGQAFVDELFRVWAREHPSTKLLPTNMVGAVRMMVERGLPEYGERSP